MSKIYEKNLKVWSQICANFYEKRDILEKIDLENGTVKSKEEGNVFVENGKEYKLCSRNTERETLLFTKEINFKKDNLIVLVGVGNIQLLEYLIERMTKETKIMIYEPNVAVLKYVLWNYDISHVFETKQVALLIDLREENKLEQEMMFYCSMNWGIMAKNLKVIALPNYYLYRDKTHYFVKKWIELIDSSIKRLGNSLEDVFNGFENNYKNIDVMVSSNSIKEIEGKYKGYPAIIVASGPSLDKNIDKLKLAQEKALIISCDASLDACIANDVKPDAIASIERDAPTYEFYYKGKQFDKDLVLVGPTVLWPEIYKEFPGKRIVMSKNDVGVDGWWSEHFENVDFVSMGFSCANVALAVAKRAGCNPIILMGQDLAYTDDKKHSNQTHTEFEGENDNSESDGNMVEDIYGNLLSTDIVYNLFRVWIENLITGNSEITVIDATEGGAKIQGSKIMTLEDAIAQYCNKTIPKHMYEFLEDVPFDKELIGKKCKEIITSTENIMEQLDEIRKESKDHFKLLQDLYREDIGKMKEKQWIRLVKKMQKGNTIIQKIQEQKYILNYYQPIIKQTVIYVKAIGNELNEANIRRNIELQLNLMQMLYNSTGLIKEEYEKLILYLKNKENDEE